MSWRPAPQDDEQAEIVRRALAEAVDASGWSRREVDRRVGWTENYLSQMLRDAADLKLVHVSAVLRVLGIEPADFYGMVFQRAEEGPSDTAILKTLTKTMKRYEQQLKAVQKRLDEAIPAGSKGSRGRGSEEVPGDRGTEGPAAPKPHSARSPSLS